MRSALVIAILLVCSYAEFSHEDAVRYVWASSYAYCDSMDTDDCGKSSAMIHQLGYDVLDYKKTGFLINKINAIIFKDDLRKELVVAFSGTKDPV